MANCKKCKYFSTSSFSCTNRNVSAQHKLGGESCSFFYEQRCKDCIYCHKGSGLFVRMNHYCSAKNDTQVYPEQIACDRFK